MAFLFLHLKAKMGWHTSPMLDCKMYSLGARQSTPDFLGKSDSTQLLQGMLFQWCLDSRVWERSYQDLRNAVYKHQERKTSLAWPCKHPLLLSMLSMLLTLPVLPTLSSIPSFLRTSELWVLSVPSRCSPWWKWSARLKQDEFACGRGAV